MVLGCSGEAASCCVQVPEHSYVVVRLVSLLLLDSSNLPLLHWLRVQYRAPLLSSLLLLVSYAASTPPATKKHLEKPVLYELL